MVITLVGIRRQKREWLCPGVVWNTLEALSWRTPTALSRPKETTNSSAVPCAIAPRKPSENWVLSPYCASLIASITPWLIVSKTVVDTNILPRLQHIIYCIATFPACTINNTKHTSLMSHGLPCVCRSRHQYSLCKHLGSIVVRTSMAVRPLFLLNTTCQLETTTSLRCNLVTSCSHPICLLRCVLDAKHSKASPFRGLPRQPLPEHEGHRPNAPSKRRVAHRAGQGRTGRQGRAAPRAEEPRGRNHERAGRWLPRSCSRRSCRGCCSCSARLSCSVLCCSESLGACLCSFMLSQSQSQTTSHEKGGRLTERAEWNGLKHDMFVVGCRRSAVVSCCCCGYYLFFYGWVGRINAPGLTFGCPFPISVSVVFCIICRSTQGFSSFRTVVYIGIDRSVRTIGNSIYLIYSTRCFWRNAPFDGIFQLLLFLILVLERASFAVAFFRGGGMLVLWPLGILHDREGTIQSSGFGNQTCWYCVRSSR